MANQQQLMAVFSFLLLLALASTSVAADEENSYAETKIDVAVEGTVYCQGCTHHGTWSLADAKPIPGAKVSIICKDYKNRVSFYKVCTTDKEGYFYEALQGFTLKHIILDHPLHGCTVHPVSSSLPNCRLVTNVNYGLDGAPFRYEDKRLFGTNYEVVVYTAGPLAFRPAHCPPKSHY
ncbi:non-classical arabinogalactan protein 30 [Macadamia integrifolia]|uniref:non-classical arabinogalactan protein 30 n=1 Tax=Macadamia integrifolia TaxID=60698 RepID=UPI001C4FA2D4|nr:non-classical arabinogalactan protein 30 [Macadamia integrifolia]